MKYCSFLWGNPVIPVFVFTPIHQMWVKLITFQGIHLLGHVAPSKEAHENSLTMPGLCPSSSWGLWCLQHLVNLTLITDLQKTRIPFGWFPHPSPWRTEKVSSKEPNPRPWNRTYLILCGTVGNSWGSVSKNTFLLSRRAPLSHVLMYAWGLWKVSTRESFQRWANLCLLPERKEIITKTRTSRSSEVVTSPESWGCLLQCRIYRSHLWSYIHPAFLFFAWHSVLIPSNHFPNRCLTCLPRHSVVSLAVWHAAAGVRLVPRAAPAIEALVGSKSKWSENHLGGSAYFSSTVQWKFGWK